VKLLQERFPDGKWEKERTIPEHKERNIPQLRPDLSGRIRGRRVAIEIQASTLTIAKLIKRLTDYTKRDISLLWLVPLREPLGELPFRPRLYERYLHNIYYGRTYYWWAGQGLVIKPVHYGLYETRLRPHGRQRQRANSILAARNRRHLWYATGRVL